MKVFYRPGERFVFDEVISKGGIEIGLYCRKTIEQAKVENPALTCIEYEAAVAQIVALAVCPPQEITEEVFSNMLDVLPPCAWVKAGGCESFHMSEFDVYNVTGIYIRIGQRYFSFKDVFTLTHEERITRVRKAFPDVS